MLKYKQTIAIIGGGITGLTTAYYLQKFLDEHNLSINIILIEASQRLGGKVQTLYKDGFVIERGPDAFLEQKEKISQLAEEIGMKDEIVHSATSKMFILARGKLHEIPENTYMGIPTRIAPYVTTKLFSLQGKIRALCDLILPRDQEKADQPLGDFFRRRLGDELVENLIEPLLSGVYAGDIDQLSLMSTFPNFYNLEQKYRSLIFGMRKNIIEAKEKPKQQSGQGDFLNFKRGLQSFVENLENQLGKVNVIKSTRVENVLKSADQYEIYLNSGEIVLADSLVVTTPHLEAEKMFSNYNAFEPLKDMPATSVASVTMAFPKEAIIGDMDGTEFFVSRNTEFSITACKLTHKNWPYFTPEGKVLLRCFVGRLGHETIVDLSDDKITNIVLEDLQRIIGMDSDPEFSIVTRWKNSMPQYTVGHLERLAKVRKDLKEQLPGVFLAGSSYDGQSLSKCIMQAENVANQILDFLKVK